MKKFISLLVFVFVSSVTMSQEITFNKFELKRSSIVTNYNDYKYNTYSFNLSIKLNNNTNKDIVYCEVNYLTVYKDVSLPHELNGWFKHTVTINEKIKKNKKHICNAISVTYNDKPVIAYPYRIYIKYVDNTDCTINIDQHNISQYFQNIQYTKISNFDDTLNDTVSIGLFNNIVDEFSSNGMSYIKPLNMPDSNFETQIYPYIVMKNGKPLSLLLYVHYYANDWLFIKDIAFNVDGVAYDNFYNFNEEYERIVTNTGNVIEYSSYVMQIHTDFIEDILNCEEHCKVKLSGKSQYTTFELTAGQLRAMQRIFKYYKKLSENN